MTSSAPASRANLALASVDTVPMTRAPAAFASCVISRPAPPAAAWTSAVSPFFSGNVDRVKIVRGHALQHERGGCSGIDAIGHPDQLGCGNNCVLGVGSRGHGPGDTIAGLPFDDTFAYSFDDAGAFHSRREGKRHFVEARPVIDVDEVDAGCFELYQDVFFPGFGVRRFVNAELFGTAGLVDSYGFHRLTLQVYERGVLRL